MKYYIKSNLNGKFLSHLFEDNHTDMFTARKADAHAYWYRSNQTASEIAKELNGTVVIIGA